MNLKEKHSFASRKVNSLSSLDTSSNHLIVIPGSGSETSLSSDLRDICEKAGIDTAANWEALEGILFQNKRSTKQKDSSRKKESIPNKIEIISVDTNFTKKKSFDLKLFLLQDDPYEMKTKKQADVQSQVDLKPNKPVPASRPANIIYPKVTNLGRKSSPVRCSRCTSTQPRVSRVREGEQAPTKSQLSKRKSKSKIITLQNLKTEATRVVRMPAYTFAHDEQPAEPLQREENIQE